MRLEITYAPTTRNHCRVCITVLDREDFPSDKIFHANHNYPSAPGYAIFPGHCNNIVNVLPTKKLAKQWAEIQMKALRKQLDDWRDPAIKESHFQYI